MLRLYVVKNASYPGIDCCVASGPVKMFRYIARFLCIRDDVKFQFEQNFHGRSRYEQD